MPVNFKDLGIGKLRALFGALGKSEITIGWQGASGAEQHPGGDASNAKIGALHELGTATMPARPVLTLAMQDAIDALNDTLAAELRDAIDSGEVGDLAAKIGEQGVAAVREFFELSPQWADPLAESTAKRKGHDHPLFDTGALMDSVSWAERKGGAVKRQGGER